MRNAKRKRRLGHMEQLECRVVLDGNGVLWGVDAGLSLSFVPDGTKVGPETSELFDSFSHLGSEDVWQEAILRGFQIWARQTNADIGVVPDDGSDLGVEGATAGDPRFGDIRIAGFPMESDFFATSIPTNELLDGTWVGDVFFNSNASIESLDELFAISLHEAGHVFGLEHSNDSASPLFRHDLPESTVPTATDLAALRQLYGPRRGDLSEAVEDALEIEMKDEGNASTPGIAFGDIGSITDVDVFKLKMPDGDENGDVLSIRLVTKEISLLRGRIWVETIDGTPLGEANYEDANELGQTVLLHSTATAEEKVFVYVSADSVAPYDVGAYSVVATYDQSNVVPDDVIKRVATSRIRSIEQDDIQRFFQSSFMDDDDVLLDDDMGSDDSQGNEIELLEDDEFPGFARFVTMNALSSETDVDRYEIRVPEGQGQGVVTVSLSSLTDGFHGTLEVDSVNPVEIRQLINSNQFIVSQIHVAEAGDILTFEVGRDANSPNPLGNYELMIRFGQDPITPHVVATGAVDSSGQDEYPLTVNRSQLFRFGLRPLAADAPVTLQVSNAAGELVTEFTSTDGELATGSILLLPGEYKIAVTSQVAASYELLADSVDEPLGIEPVDPTEAPFCGVDFTGLFRCILLFGDINNDGKVDFDDFLTLSSNFGDSDVSRLDGDLDGDNRVAFSDFLILSQNFGQQNPEPE